MSRKLLLGVLGVVLACGGAFGQTNQGSIAGNVLDSSGAVVPDAKIVARGVSTGTTYETVSSSAGSYRLASVIAGTYDVTVNKAGFKEAVLKGVEVHVGTTSTLDAHLQIGAVTESVEVSAGAPTVQADSVDMGNTVTTKQALDLPLPLGSVVQAMRSPEAFVFLTPGTVGPGTDSGSGGTFESKISGGQNYATEVLLDGANTYRSENGSSFDECAPSVDALGEFKVITSTLPAEMGRTTGGVESFSTKAGTNDFHGSVYDIFRNEDLDANTYFNNHVGLPRPLDKQNDYGLTFGGPVWVPKLYHGRNKTFFFFSWEQYRQNSGGVSNITVPTAKERTGDFSEFLGAGIVSGGSPVLNPCDGTQLRLGQIFDPATTQTVGSVQCRTAFAGNVIPAIRQSAVAKNILSYYPPPQNSNLSLNYAFPWAFPILDTAMTVRLDHNFSNTQKAYFTYSSRDNARDSTTPIFDNAAGQGRFQTFFTHFIRLGWDATVTPTALNHLNIGFNRTDSANIGAGVRFGGDWAATLGITGTASSQFTTSTFPSIGIAGVTAMGDSVNGDTIDNGWRFNDTFEWVKGKHDFKFGVEVSYQPYEPLDYSRSTGAYNFATSQTAGTTTQNGPTGLGVASELLGLVDNANLFDHTTQPKWLSSYYAGFFQDSYKLTPTFTLLYGMRWDVDMPHREANGNTSNISLTTPNPGANGHLGALVFAGVGSGRTGNVNERWAKTWLKDWGPRVGFAWSPSQLHNTVIRGGYGIIYGPLLYADFGGFNRVGFTGNPAFSTLDGFAPAFKIDSGFPAYTAAPNLDPTQLNYSGPQYTDPSFGRPPMVNNWSLEVQRELATDLILDVAYVGEHSSHLRSNYDAFNSLDPKYLTMGSLLGARMDSPAAIAANIPLPYASFPTNLIVAQALVPFPQYFGFNTDGTLENLGFSRYDALQASLRRRFRKGLNLMVSYTWSKTLTDADAALPFFATLHGGGSAQNPFNLKGEKAISNQDIPQMLVVSYIYELPFGKGKKYLSRGGASNRVVGGWQIGGIHRYQSGQPMSFCCGTGIPAFAGAIRYNRVQGQSLYSSQFLSGHFDPFTDPMFNIAAFSDPNAGARISAGGAYAFGDMARTTGEARMGRFLDEDFSLIKRTTITERTALAFTATVVDAFNRHIFNRPTDFNIYDTGGGFGKLDPNNLILGPRKIQLQLKLEF